jgi:hypothetical protein
MLSLPAAYKECERGVSSTNDLHFFAPRFFFPSLVRTIHVFRVKSIGAGAKKIRVGPPKIPGPRGTVRGTKTTFVNKFPHNPGRGAGPGGPGV